MTTAVARHDTFIGKVGSDTSHDSNRPDSATLRRRHALTKLIAGEHTGPISEKNSHIAEKTVDWSPWYLTEKEDMGQSGQQEEIIYTLKSSLEVWSKERAWQSVRVGSDNFFAWVKSESNVQVSPDVFLLDHPPDETNELPRRWETWRPEHRPPRFAIEIVSADWKKDYEINPDRYDHLGTDELVIVDPDAFSETLEHAVRAPFTVYRRSESDRLDLVYRGLGPVYCREIAAYLRFVWATPGRVRVRLARDAQGRDIVPSAHEMATAAEEKIASLEAELAELRARQ